MKALFCHDHYYYKDNDDVISKGQYHHAVWQRYLEHFKSITVIGRDGGQASKSDVGVNIASRDNVSFNLFPNTNSLHGLIKGRSNTKKQIAKLVSEHDVIILRGISELGSIAFDEAKKQGKVIALEMVSCAWDELWYNGSIKAKIYAPYRLMLAKYIAKNVDAIIYVSQKFLQKRYRSNIKLQAVASNVQITKDAFNKIELENKNRYKVGLIGTLKNKLKGVHIAIEACKILKDQNITNFDLHILGPGDPLHFQNQANVRHVSEQVHFDGLRQSGRHVWEWLRDLDLYIQPSFQEGVPRATIEAMAQGLPVIGSDAGGIPEILDSDVIVPRGDAVALANKIEWMLSNLDIRQTNSEINYVTAQKYTANKLNIIRHKFWSDVKIKASQNLPK